MGKAKSPRKEELRRGSISVYVKGGERSLLQPEITWPWQEQTLIQVSKVLQTSVRCRTIMDSGTHIGTE